MKSRRQRSEKPPAKHDFCFSENRLRIGAVILLAFVVRLIVVWELAANNPGFALPDVDSGWHFQWAKLIASGEWIGSEAFYRAPLYPYLLAVWIKIFGDGLWLIRLIQISLGAVTAGLVMLLGGRLFGRRIALMAGLAWALWGPMIYYETELLIPVLILPLNLAALWWAVGREEHPGRSWKAWLGIGLILGISAIARPNILITIPAFLWMAWPPGKPSQRLGQRLAAPLAVVLGVLLPIIPVTARNYAVSGDPVLIAYQGGVNLYLANNAEADGLTMQMPEVSLDPTLSWDEFVGTTDSIAAVQAGHPLRPSEISSFWTSKALRYMRTHPGATVTRWAQKTFYLLNGFEVGDQTDIYAHTRFSRLLRMLIWHAGVFFPFGLIAPLALVGMGWAWRRVPKSRGVIIFAALYALSVIGFLATARHRLPIVPILVIFSAVGAMILVNAWRGRRRVPALAITALALVLLVVLNLPTVAQIMHNPAFTLYQQALIHDRRGEYQQAIDLYGEALNLEPMLLAARRNLALALVRNKQCDLAITVSKSYLQFRKDDAEALNNLGLANLCLADTTKAMGFFRIASRNNPRLPQPHLNRGNVYLARGEINLAAGAYQQCIEADSSFGPCYNSLAVLYARSGQLDTAISILERCTRRNPDHASAWANLGNMHIESGRPAEAIKAMKHALELQPEALTVRYNLAVVYVRMDDTDAAVAQLEGILEIDPEHLPALQLLERLRQGGSATP